MTSIFGCPFGLEDGHILGYRTDSTGLEVDYEFWNEAFGTFCFYKLVGMRDNSAIGVTVGAFAIVNSSELLSVLISRNFEQAPESLGWNGYQFLDLDDKPMFEVVAEECLFKATKYE